MSAPKVDFPYGTGGGGGGGVSGSGTAGTVPVWSGSTALGDSPLTVSGTAVTGSGPIRATGTSATTPAFTGSDTDTGLYFPAVNQVHLSTAGTLAIAIDASQNVGVNAASPAGKLHVALGTGFSPGASWTSSTAVFGGTGVNAGALGVAYDGTNGASLISIEPTVGWKTLSYHALDHRWNVAGSGEFMRLSSGGLLSVGTTSATAGRALTTVADLDVYGVRVGRGAGAVSTNTAVGASALNANTTGANIVAIGWSAGANATGSNNTFIGYNTQPNAATDSNEIVIGYNVTGAGSNTTTLGNSSTTTTVLPAGVLQLAAGTAGAPAYTTAGDLDTGIYFSAANAVNFAEGGTGFRIGYRNLPAVGTKTASYTLATADVGKYVQVSTGGSITIPDATFAEGDVVTIANNTTGDITITCSITTAYIAGTNVDQATMTLATRGVATVLFLSGTVCIVSGSVS